MYSCTLSALLDVLATTSRDEAKQLLIQYRNSEHGLLSVGLKIHMLGTDAGVDELVHELDGTSPPAPYRNYYQQKGASLCLVLPPVGSAGAAIRLLDLIGRHTGCPMFGNPNIQLQMCTPGRLDNRRSGMLAIAFYLGSDTLRRFTFDQLTTTVSNDNRYNRGRRLVIYDAPGAASEFDYDFEWWQFDHKRGLRLGRRLPFDAPQRTDLLIGAASRLDIDNVNLAATLLVHSQFKEHRGRWQYYGEEFERSITTLLRTNLLTGLLEAPWVHLGGVKDTQGDNAFFSAIEELMASAFEDSARIQKNLRSYFKNMWEMRPPGLLEEMNTLIRRHRQQLVLKAQELKGGDT